MAAKRSPPHSQSTDLVAEEYDQILTDVVRLLDGARRAAARSVNAVMTQTHWLIGRRIVDCELGGQKRAGYGEELIDRLAADLTARFGRGFGRRNLFLMRSFYLAYSEMPTLGAPSLEIVQSSIAQLGEPSGSDIVQAAIAQSQPPAFPLPWTQYVRLNILLGTDGRAVCIGHQFDSLDTPRGSCRGSIPYN